MGLVFAMTMSSGVVNVCLLYEPLKSIWDHLWQVVFSGLGRCTDFYSVSVTHTPLLPG